MSEQKTFENRPLSIIVDVLQRSTDLAIALKGENAPQGLAKFLETLENYNTKTGKDSKTGRNLNNVAAKTFAGEILKALTHLQTVNNTAFTAIISQLSELFGELDTRLMTLKTSDAYISFPDREPFNFTATKDSVEKADGQTLAIETTQTTEILPRLQSYILQAATDTQDFTRPIKSAPTTPAKRKSGEVVSDVVVPQPLPSVSQAPAQVPPVNNAHKATVVIAQPNGLAPKPSPVVASVQNSGGASSSRKSITLDSALLVAVVDSVQPAPTPEKRQTLVDSLYQAIEDQVLPKEEVDVKTLLTNVVLVFFPDNTGGLPAPMFMRTSFTQEFNKQLQRNNELEGNYSELVVTGNAEFASMRNDVPPQSNASLPQLRAHTAAKPKTALTVNAGDVVTAVIDVVLDKTYADMRAFRKAVSDGLFNVLATGLTNREAQHPALSILLEQALQIAIPGENDGHAPSAFPANFTTEALNSALEVHLPNIPVLDNSYTSIALQGDMDFSALNEANFNGRKASSSAPSPHPGSSVTPTKQKALPGGSGHSTLGGMQLRQVVNAQLTPSPSGTGLAFQPTNSPSKPLVSTSPRGKNPFVTTAEELAQGDEVWTIRDLAVAVYMQMGIENPEDIFPDNAKGKKLYLGPNAAKSFKAYVKEHGQIAGTVAANKAFFEQWQQAPDAPEVNRTGFIPVFSNKPLLDSIQKQISKKLALATPTTNPQKLAKAIEADVVNLIDGSAKKYHENKGLLDAAKQSVTDYFTDPNKQTSIGTVISIPTEERDTDGINDLAAQKITEAFQVPINALIAFWEGQKPSPRSEEEKSPRKKGRLLKQPSGSNLVVPKPIVAQNGEDRPQQPAEAVIVNLQPLANALFAHFTHTASPTPSSVRRATRPLARTAFEEAFPDVNTHQEVNNAVNKSIPNGTEQLDRTELLKQLQKNLEEAAKLLADKLKRDNLEFTFIALPPVTRPTSATTTRTNLQQPVQELIADLMPELNAEHTATEILEHAFPSKAKGEKYNPDEAAKILKDLAEALRRMAGKVRGANQVDGTVEYGMLYPDSERHAQQGGRPEDVDITQQHPHGNVIHLFKTEFAKVQAAQPTHSGQVKKGHAVKKTADQDASLPAEVRSHVQYDARQREEFDSTEIRQPAKPPVIEEDHQSPSGLKPQHGTAPKPTKGKRVNGHKDQDAPLPSQVDATVEYSARQREDFDSTKVRHPAKPPVIEEDHRSPSGQKPQRGTAPKPTKGTLVGGSSVTISDGKKPKNATLDPALLGYDGQVSSGVDLGGSQQAQQGLAPQPNMGSFVALIQQQNQGNGHRRERKPLSTTDYTGRKSRYSMQLDGLDDSKKKDKTR